MSGRASAVAGSQAHTLSNPEPSSGAGPATKIATHLELAALPSAVPCARAHTRLVLVEWGLGHLGESAVLVLTELLTNAIQASQGLDGCWFGGQHHPGPDEESGRGLVIVEALSACHGTERLDGATGKLCWAIVTGARP